jgi:hypothetical protein
VWGELAIALWSQGDCSAGYEAWKCGIEELLKAKDDTDNWKILFQIMEPLAKLKHEGHFLFRGGPLPA